MGSHGPAYFKRSPPDLKPFQPECRSNELQQCPTEQVVNGYDNTIATTDRLIVSYRDASQADAKDTGVLRAMAVAPAALPRSGRWAAGATGA